MPQIAVDIVLLPPPPIMQICIDINEQKQSQSFQHLNSKDNWPHISLAMGILDTKDLIKAKEILDKLPHDFTKLDLELTKISYIVASDNKKSHAFDVAVTRELQNLHNKIMNEFSGILIYDQVNSDMFFTAPGEKIDDVTLYWVKNYPEKSFNNFQAHISLKCRHAEYKLTPISFVAETLALCRLGNFGTCRQILHSVKLK